MMPERPPVHAVRAPRCRQDSERFDALRHTVDELGEGEEAARLIMESYQGVSEGRPSLQASAELAQLLLVWACSLVSARTSLQHRLLSCRSVAPPWPLLLSFLCC